MLSGRQIHSDEDAKRLFVSLIPAYDEVGRSTGDANKAFIELYHSVKTEYVFVVENGQGEIVASCGIYHAPGMMFYSSADWLKEKWLYIGKHDRSDTLGSGPFRILLSMIQKTCNETGLACIIRVFNQTRTKRKSHIARIAEDFCCFPAGSVIEISPKKAA